jgi:hypothetical protein
VEHRAAGEIEHRLAASMEWAWIGEQLRERLMARPGAKAWGRGIGLHCDLCLGTAGQMSKKVVLDFMHYIDRATDSVCSLERGCRSDL